MTQNKIHSITPYRETYLGFEIRQAYSIGYPDSFIAVRIDDPEKVFAGPCTLDLRQDIENWHHENE